MNRWPFQIVGRRNIFANSVFYIVRRPISARRKASRVTPPSRSSEAWILSRLTADSARRMPLSLT